MIGDEQAIEPVIERKGGLIGAELNTGRTSGKCAAIGGRRREQRRGQRSIAGGVFSHRRERDGATTRIYGKFFVRRVSIVNRRVELRVTKRKTQLRNMQTTALRTSVELKHEACKL